MTLKKFVSKHEDKIVDGFINANLPWFSPLDLAKTFGFSRQYWCKLISSGRLESHKTSASPIVTTEQLIKFSSTLDTKTYGV